MDNMKIKKKNFTFRLLPEQLTLLKDKAERVGTTPSNILRGLIDSLKEGS